jgi:hypothetical protein
MATGAAAAAAAVSVQGPWRTITIQWVNGSCCLNVFVLSAVGLSEGMLEQPQTECRLRSPAVFGLRATEGSPPVLPSPPRAETVTFSTGSTKPNLFLFLLRSMTLGAMKVTGELKYVQIRALTFRLPLKATCNTAVISVSRRSQSCRCVLPQTSFRAKFETSIRLKNGRR